MSYFPDLRLRRMRQKDAIRDLVREVEIRPQDLILPLFVRDGVKKQEEVKTIPGIYRYSEDLLLKEIELAAKLGIKAVALFPQVDPKSKTADCEAAYDKNNLICKTLRKVKATFPEMLLIADVALDPYNANGHDGIVLGGEVDNDKTIEILAKQAKAQAEAGADIIAPSDMMDGRIGFIRGELDLAGFDNIIILAYTAKYASKLYGPFRDAIGSDGALKGASKSTYQMDFANKREAILEAEQDEQEGADILMVKPASFYLDIIQDLSQNSNLPVFAYQVSGELAMLKYAAEAGCFSYQDILHESLVAIKRAGARSILCYDAISYLKGFKD